MVASPWGAGRSFGRRLGFGRHLRARPQQAVDAPLVGGSGSLMKRTRRWREPDSNLYGAFPVKWSFGLLAGSLFGAGKSFFVPSPAIRFAERAEGVKGPKR